MPRKRNVPSFAERAMGVQAKGGKVSAQALDFFANVAARTGFGSPNLTEAAEYPLVRFTFNYWNLISLYEGSWIARRIIDTPASDMVRAWPKITSDIDPKDLTKIDRALRRTNAKNNLLTAMVWGRLFGGAGALIVIKGQ
jgi:phage-related protein (TIGR01555 family)